MWSIFRLQNVTMHLISIALFVLYYDLEWREGRAECKIADVNEARKGSEGGKEGGREGGGPMCVARRSQVWHGREGMGRAEREGERD